MISLTDRFSFILALVLCGAGGAAEGADFKSGFYAVSLDPAAPAFTWFSVDSLGRGDDSRNTIRLPAPARGALELERNTAAPFCYMARTPDQKSAPVWEIRPAEKVLTLSSHYVAEVALPPFTLAIDQAKNHATLLGLLQPDGKIQLPAVLHLPDQGTFRISSPTAGSIGYEAANGVVKIIFASATAGDPAVEYRCEVVDIYPKVDGVETDDRFDGFRRNWLNILQISPQWRMLANHSTSDTCAFCYYEYADIARRTPSLAANLTALDLVRQSLDQIIHGAKAYGMPGHGAFPEFASDTLPSLLIAASDSAQGETGRAWLATNYEHLKSWADTMLATDRNGDGFVKYVLGGNSGSWPQNLKYRPANWWDTIGFGHEDAYANALAYRALRGMEEMAGQTDHSADQARYRAAADKLRDAYFKAFFNPATGVLAGWRSADGQLHDYYFPWVSGIAIHYGLVPEKEANLIMNRLLAKMKGVGYTRFDLGLPGNLIPVPWKDYVAHDHRWGGGTNQDGSDGFQIYENGGATACFAYFTLAALYDLGRIGDGDRILFPMLHSFATGDFQGRGANGMSKDWRTWDGTCWGYEGFLVDNYYALLAVLDREAALKNQARGRSLRR